MVSELADVVARRYSELLLERAKSYRGRFRSLGRHDIKPGWSVGLRLMRSGHHSDGKSCSAQSSVTDI